MPQITERVFGIDYIDEIEVHQLPSRRRLEVLVQRKDVSVAERISLQHGAPWVAWRKTMPEME